MKEKFTLHYLAKNMAIIIGLVLIWRGIWHILDGADIYLFDGNKMITAFGGIALGLLMLYLPDKDLKEIQKL